MQFCESKRENCPAKFFCTLKSFVCASIMFCHFYHRWFRHRNVSHFTSPLFVAFIYHEPNNCAFNLHYYSSLESLSSISEAFIISLFSLLQFQFESIFSPRCRPSKSETQNYPSSSYVFVLVVGGKCFQFLPIKGDTNSKAQKVVIYEFFITHYTALALDVFFFVDLICVALLFYAFYVLTIIISAFMMMIKSLRTWFNDCTPMSAPKVIFHLSVALRNAQWKLGDCGMNSSCFRGLTWLLSAKQSLHKQ